MSATINNSSLIRFDTIFPEFKGKKPLRRDMLIQLARKVAIALEKESEQLVAKENQPNPPSTRFFSQT